MKAKDCSQNELARRASVRPGYFSMILNGKRRPSWDVAVNLQAATGIEASAFMEAR